MARSQPASPTLLRLTRAAGGDPAPDADLLARFTQANDEAAFAALVERHGPMVLGVCRRVVGDHHAAEDAFQAAFLTLARNGGRVRDPRAVAAWLYGTAVRVSLKARRTAARKRATERSAQPRPGGDPLADITGRELVAALDEELARLPEQFRAAVVLCCLDGLSQADAAHRLGCSPAALRGRLERGRDRLRAGLARRGIALPTVLTFLAAADAAAIVPPPLFGRTVDLVGTGPVSPAVASLAASAPTALGKYVALALVVLASGLAVALGGGDPPKAEPPTTPAAAPARAAGEPLPAGAVARLGTVRQRHGRAVGVWFTPDGKTVRAFGDGPAVRTWDAATGKLLDTKILPVDYRIDDSRANYPGGTGSYSRDVANAVSADGRVLATRSAAFDRQRFYDLADGKVLAEMPVSPPAWSEHAVLSADGSLLVSCDFPQDGKDVRYAIRAFDVRAGTVKVLFQSVDRFWSIFPTADGKHVVLVSTSMRERKGAECWDVAAGKQVWQIDGGFPMSGLSDDGRTFVGMADFAAGVRAWDVATGKPAAGLKLPGSADLKLTIALDNMRVGLHGTTLTLANDTECAVWDAAAGQPAGRLPGGYGPVAASPDGKTLVTAGDTLQRWDLATGKPLWPDTRGDGHSGLVRSVRFAADGRKLFSNGSDLTLRAWDVPTGVGRVLQRGGQGYVVPATPTADGRFVLTRRDGVNGPSEIAVVDAASGKEVRSIKVQDAAEGSPMYAIPFHLGLTPGGGTVAGVVMVHTPGKGSEYAAARWDVATGKYLGRRLMPGVGGYPLSPDQRFAAGSETPYDGFVFDTATGTKIPLKHDGREVRRRLPVFSADGRLAAAPTDNGRTPVGDAVVTIWDVATGEKLDRLPAATGQVRFTADGRGLIAADKAGIGVWDLASGKRVTWHPVPAAMPADGPTFVTAWDATPDGRTLATGHADGTILLWDVTPPARTAAPPLTDPDRVWAELVGADPVKAYRAGWELAARPGQLVALVRAKVSPVAAADADAVAKHAAALDSAAFADRDAAEKALLKLGPATAPALRGLLAATPSVEQRNRAEKILASFADRLTRLTPTAAELPGVRAVAALERAGTKDALALLDHLAAGVPDARLTHDAKAAAARLRPAVRP